MQNKELMYGLDPNDKTHCVYHYHLRMVKAASKTVGIMGYTSFADVKANDIMHCVNNKVCTLSECFPGVELGCLLEGVGPTRLQEVWDRCSRVDNVIINQRWIH
jgi:hypothetical protein